MKCKVADFTKGIAFMDMQYFFMECDQPYK